jgi:hypothetical protein
MATFIKGRWINLDKVIEIELFESKTSLALPLRRASDLPKNAWAFRLASPIWKLSLKTTGRYGPPRPPLSLTCRAPGTPQPRGIDMGGKGAGVPLSVKRRKQLFRAVVEIQDRGVGPVVTRRRVAKLFGVTEAQVRRIEEEGLEGQWPPL